MILRWFYLHHFSPSFPYNGRRRRGTPVGRPPPNDRGHPVPLPRLPALLLAALAGAAALPSVAQVVVANPWVRGTVAGQKATGAFMELKSATDTSLVSAASPVAGIVEVHEMKMDAGVMRMNAVDKLALPAGKAVELRPGGYHVMLMDLKQTLKEGDTVPVTLTFEDKAGGKQTVEVKAPVRALASAGAPKKP